MGEVKFYPSVYVVVFWRKRAHRSRANLRAPAELLLCLEFAVLRDTIFPGLHDDADDDVQMSKLSAGS